MKLKSRQDQQTERTARKKGEAKGGRRRRHRAEKRDRDKRGGKHGPLRAWSEERKRKKEGEKGGRAKAVVLSVAGVGAAIAAAVGAKRLLGRSSGAEVEGVGDQPAPVDNGPTAAEVGEPETKAGGDGTATGA